MLEGYGKITFPLPLCLVASPDISKENRCFARNLHRSVCGTILALTTYPNCSVRYRRE